MNKTYNSKQNWQWMYWAAIGIAVVYPLLMYWFSYYFSHA